MEQEVTGGTCLCFYGKSKAENLTAIQGQSNQLKTVRGLEKELSSVVLVEEQASVKMPRTSDQGEGNS